MTLGPLGSADAALLRRAAEWHPTVEARELTVERLGDIAREKGADFATALLHERLRREPSNAAFRKAVETRLSNRARHPSELAATMSLQSTVDVVGIVPGAFHGQHRHTGADGVRISSIVESLAPTVETIGVRSFGALEENAAIILDWLVAQRGKRVALVSLSKGGADVKRAIASPRAERAFHGVRSWVSFSGIVEGTPLVAWLRARRVRSAAFALLLRFQGNRSAVIDELRRSPEGPLALWPQLPAHLRIVHVHGCPTANHLTHRWAPRGYQRLLPLGPNDGGGILLGDLPRLPGIVFTIWGADHYLQPTWEATALLRAIVETALDFDESRQATQLAHPPTNAPATRSIA